MDSLPDDGLEVDYCGEITHLSPGDELTFGRAGDLSLDDNPHMHRIVGRFVRRSDMWWVVNEGTTIPLLVTDRDSMSSVYITTGRTAPLSFTRAAIRFSVGPTDYEIEIATAATHDLAQDAPVDHNDEPTLRLSDVPLTAEQRLLLVWLAQEKLRSPHRSTEILPNQYIAQQLGWTITKLNRKLDNLCRKFSDLGVRGLKGDIGALASDRRRRLVDAVVEHGVISTDDLSLIDTA